MISPLTVGDSPVLIVDDELTVLGAVSDYLRAYGFPVDEAQELEEAEALVATSDYAIAIVDIRLTGVHGREGLELLRFIHQHCPAASVIVMTAHGDEHLEREARRRGADIFLEKPIPLSDLLIVVHQLLLDRVETIAQETYHV